MRQQFSVESFSDNDYFISDDNPSLSLPFTMLCWCWQPGTTGSNPDYQCSFHDSGVGNHRYAIGLASNLSRIVAIAGGSASIATSDISHPINEWFLMGGVAASATDRRAFINDNFGSPQTSNRDAVNATEFMVGRIPPTGFSFQQGRFAHLCIWDEALTQSDLAFLYNNGHPVDPRLMRPHALRLYHPFTHDYYDASTRLNPVLRKIGNGPQWAPGTPLLVPPKKFRKDDYPRVSGVVPPPTIVHDVFQTPVIGAI